MSTVNDWLLGCFDAHLVQWNKDMPECGSVHHGFIKHYRSIEKEIPITLRDYVHAGYSVTFTGHSQGGALAVYAALEVSEICEKLKSSLTLITFGSPKVGNQKFRNYFKECVSPERVYRYISSYPARVPIYDSITRVPPPLMGFKQVYGQKRFVMVPTEHFGSYTVDLGNVTKSLPLSFTIHFKEIYFQGITMNRVCHKPFTTKCAKTFVAELKEKETDFKRAMCSTYRSIHHLEFDAFRPEDIPDEK
jgi:hypothetical protein